MRESQSVGNSNGLDPELAQQAGVKVAIALERGNVEQAHTIIDDAVKPKAASQDNYDVLELPLTATELETRIINLLEKAGIYTVGELLATPREELLERPNFGPRSLEEILAAVAELGFEEEEGDHG